MLVVCLLAAAFSCGGKTVLENPSTSGTGGASISGGSGGANVVEETGGTTQPAGTGGRNVVGSGGMPVSVVDAALPAQPIPQPPDCPTVGDMVSAASMRACTTDADCILDTTNDCCGGRHVLGLAQKVICHNQPLDCPTCVGNPLYRTDDGRTGSHGDGIVARCIRKRCESVSPWCNDQACLVGSVCVTGCISNPSCVALPAVCGGELGSKCGRNPDEMAALNLCGDDGGSQVLVRTPNDVFCENGACTCPCR
jgi:hypothetical protein